MPGNYTVTAITIYTGIGGTTGATGQMIQAQTVNTATTYLVQRNINGTSDQTTQENGTYAVAGTTVTVTRTCPSGGIGVTYGFDATSTSFTLYSTVLEGTQALVFTKQ